MGPQECVCAKENPHVRVCGPMRQARLCVCVPVSVGPDLCVFRVPSMYLCICVFMCGSCSCGSVCHSRCFHVTVCPWVCVPMSLCMYVYTCVCPLVRMSSCVLWGGVGMVVGRHSLWGVPLPHIPGGEHLLRRDTTCLLEKLITSPCLGVRCLEPLCPPLPAALLPLFSLQ